METSRKSQVMVRAFSSRNFRLYYTGQAISVIGRGLNMGNSFDWIIFRLKKAWQITIELIAGNYIC